MKKLYLFLIILLSIQISYGQEMDINTLKSKGIIQGQVNFNENLPIPDNMPKFNVNHVIAPEIKQSKDGKLLAGKDTITDYYDRRTSLSFYSYNYTDPNTGQSITFPLTGYNNFFYFIGTKYDYSGSAKISGLLVLYAIKIFNTSYDSLGAVIYPGDATTGLPSGAVIASRNFSVADIDTNTANPVFTSILFNFPVDIGSKFVCFIQTRRGAADDDLTAVYTNTQGDGRGEKRACLITLSNNQPVTADLDQLPLTIGGQAIDFDPMILPILELSTNIDENKPITLNGMTINCISPNPAADFANIDLILEKATNLEINLHDINGRVIRTMQKSNLDAGEHNICFDLKDIPSGAYIISFVGNNSKLAVKLQVVR